MLHGTRACAVILFALLRGGTDRGAGAYFFRFAVRAVARVWATSPPAAARDSASARATRERGKVLTVLVLGSLGRCEASDGGCDYRTWSARLV